VRRVTVKRRPVLTTLVTIAVIPILIGLGARWSATSEIAQLQAANAALAVENSNYRTATNELTTQIQSLEGIVNQVDARTPFDVNAGARESKQPAAPAARPAVGSPQASALSNVLSTFTSPEDLFGVLRDLLQGLEDRLRSARSKTEKPAK